MKIGSGTIKGRIASPDTGRVKEYELTLNNISTEAESAGGEVKGRISSPDTGRVGDYTFTLDDISIEEGSEGDLTSGTVTGRIASPDTGNSGTYNLQLKDLVISGGGSGGSNVAQYWIAVDSIYWPESTDSSYPFNDVYHVFKSRPTVTVHEIPDVSDLELIWGDAEALTTDESILSDINDGKMIVFSMIEYLQVYDSSTGTSTWQYQVQPPRLVTTYYDNTSAGDLVSHYYSFPNAAYNPHGGYGNMASNTIVYAHYKDTGTTNWNYIRG